MSLKLQSKIEYLLSTNNLLVLRTNNYPLQRKLAEVLCIGRTVYNFADPMVRERALYHGEEFLAEMIKPAVIYNVQYVEGFVSLLLQQDCACGDYLLVVQQSCNIMEEISRAEFCAVVDLPLTFADDRSLFFPEGDALEAVQYKSAADASERIVAGALGTPNYADYLKNFLQSDLKDFTVVSDELKFYRFMCAVAASTGNIVNYASLGKAVEVSSPTAKQWLKYLEGAGIVVLQPAFEHQSLPRLTKAPKLYFRDTGLACYLLRIGSRSDLLHSNLLPMLFETWVVMRLRESYLQAGIALAMEYFRDSNAKEISLLLHRGGTIYPVDVKLDCRDVKKQQKKFKFLQELLAANGLDVADGCVICNCKSAEHLPEGFQKVPADIL